jgi:hypothetical protein
MNGPLPAGLQAGEHAGVGSRTIEEAVAQNGHKR